MEIERPPFLVDPQFRDPRGRAAAATRIFSTVYLAMLILLVVGQLLFASAENPPVLMRLAPGERFGWLEAALGIGVGVLLVLGQLALRPAVAWLRDFDHMMFGILGKPTVLQCLILAATSGLAEEVAFRGLLQPVAGIFIASVLFGLAHFFMWQWALFATLIGFLFGWLFELTGGGLLAPFLAHFTVNALGLWQISRECPEDAPPLEARPRPRDPPTPAKPEPPTDDPPSAPDA